MSGPLVSVLLPQELLQAVVARLAKCLPYEPLGVLQEALRIRLQEILADAEFYLSEQSLETARWEQVARLRCRCIHYAGDNVKCSLHGEGHSE